jgi:hypothetical protein
METSDNILGSSVSILCRRGLCGGTVWISFDSGGSRAVNLPGEMGVRVATDAVRGILVRSPTTEGTRHAGMCRSSSRSYSTLYWASPVASSLAASSMCSESLTKRIC